MICSLVYSKLCAYSNLRSNKVVYLLWLIFNSVNSMMSRVSGKKLWPLVVSGWDKIMTIVVGGKKF